MTLLRTIPALPVQNIARATAFYAERFGFRTDHAEGGFAIVVRDAAELHLWQASDERWKSRPAGDEHPVRSGAESFIAGTGSCRIDVDDAAALYAELAAAQVLHPTDRGHPLQTEWSTVEVATLDLDGNLLTFVERVSGGELTG